MSASEEASVPPAGGAKEVKDGDAATGDAPSQKSKAELRRERAAIQAAQRAAKESKKDAEQKAKLLGVAPPPQPKVQAPKKVTKQPAKPLVGAETDTKAKKTARKKKKKEDIGSIHPAVLRLGDRYKQHSIIGGNARCIAMLQCFKEVISDYNLEKGAGRFQDDLTNRLRKPINYLTGCRKMSVSMGNGINYLKSRIKNLPDDLPVEEAQELLLSDIDNYCQEILLADRHIAERSCLDDDASLSRRHSDHQIKNGDVVLTYVRSNVIEWAFRLAHAKGIQFEVIVVDSRPLHEGRQLALTLASLGIATTYCLFNSLSTLLAKCNKVFVGASTMLTNGSLVSRAGTAMVAMMAKHFSVPVLCFCEKYKFTDKVWLGSLTNNEEAETGELMTLMDGTPSPVASILEDSSHVDVENYMYDLTPAESIDMVVTELGPMPPTAVPVVVRERADKFLE
ncbi:Translation initiation factor eIF-2B subunit delta [Diplonema papillatum]|nr:Translation initiation factor eIF-2B subunit delta [Diplonema papillatum]